MSLFGATNTRFSCTSRNPQVSHGKGMEACVEVGFDLPCRNVTPGYHRANARRNVTITSVTFDHLPFRLTLEVQTRRIGGGYTRVKTIAGNTCGFGAGVRSQLEHSHQVCADVRI